ncbi:unnamed protein product [Closterium sp. NIES-53]
MAPLTLKPPPVAPVAPPPLRLAPSGVSHVTPQSSPPQRPVHVVSGGARGAFAEGEGTGAAGAHRASSGGAGGVRVETTLEEDTAVSTQRPCRASPPGFPSVPQGAGAGNTSTAMPTPHTLRFLTRLQRLDRLEREEWERFERAQRQERVEEESWQRQHQHQQHQEQQSQSEYQERVEEESRKQQQQQQPQSERHERVEEESRLPQQVQLQPQQERVEQESRPQQQVLLQPQQDRVEEEPREQQGGQVPQQQSPEEAKHRAVSPEPRRSRYRLDGPFHLVLCSRVPPPPVLPQPPESSLTVFHDPLSDYLHASRPVVSRVLSALVTHPTAPLSSVSALVTTIAGFTSSHCLDYAAHLVIGLARSPFSGGAPVFPLEVLEDRHFELGFLAADVPHLCAMLLAPKGDPDALDIPIPRNHDEAVSGPWASYWIAAQEAEMTSYRSTGTYVDTVPPPGANVVSGMWLYKVKRPPGSPPVFKAHYVARGFREPARADLAASFAWFHWLFPSWDPSLDFFPSSADPSLFVRRGSTTFIILVYVDDLVFTTPDRCALASVKEELQWRHTCNDLGELQRYLGLQITRDRAARTITLTQSHTVLLPVLQAVDSGLPLRFWPIAFHHATVIKNQVLTHVGGQHWVPMEKWSGKKPLVDMLRVFRCMGLVHVPKEKRDKLQAAAVWAVHLGLAWGSKSWLMWDPKSNTIFTTIDDKFMEGLMFKEWSEQGRSKVTIPLGIEVGTNDPLLIPIESSSSSEFTEVSHDLGGAEGEAADVEGVPQQGEAPIAKRGDTEEEVQQPTPSPKLPPRRTTQGKHDAVRGGAKEGADKERPKRAAHPRDFLKKALDCTWVLRVKTDAEGKLERRKTRLVIKGFQQREGIDFQEVFAPVAKAPTLRMLLATAAVCGWKVEQMEVKTAFLYGVVDEEIYMKQPEGYDDGSRRVCRLNKAIYGLKQAPRCWYARLVEALEALGFKVSGYDESLFTTEGEEEKVFLLVYALGPVGYYLGLHVERDEINGWLRLHQHKYLAAMGEKYGLEEGRSVKTPLPSGFQLHLDEEEGEVLEYELQRRFQSMVGSLMYDSVNTRPDKTFSVSQLTRVVSRPLQEHLDAAESLVWYCMATSRVGLQYSLHGQLKQKGVEEVSTKTGAPPRREHLYLSCFTDATWASDIRDATTHGGYICCVGGSPVSWKSKKQGEIAHSSTESEYMALFHGVKEVVWMRRLLEELGQEQQVRTPVFCDNQGAIAMAHNAVLHGLNKHMHIKWHWVRKEVKKGTISLHYINTTKQPADFLTKRLAEHQHWSCATLCGISFN